MNNNEAWCFASFNFNDSFENIIIMKSLNENYYKIIARYSYLCWS